MSSKPLMIVQAENSVIDVKFLWDLMPDSDKAHYGNDINVYIHHKIAQSIKDDAYDNEEGV